MLLYLVRHGETTYNAEGRIQGQSDAPLSALGHRQGQAVAEAFTGGSVGAIVSSPLRRTMETARYIAERLGLPIATDPRLMELDAGVFQGQLRSTLEESHPEILARWLGGDDDFVIPTGESRRQLAERGCAALQAIAAAHSRDVVVVTHGGLMSATLRELLSLTEPLPPFAFQNGSITRVSVNGDGRFNLDTLNDIAHLEGIGATLGGDL